MVATCEHAVTMATRLGHTPKLPAGLYGHAPEDVDRAAAERLGKLFAVTTAAHKQEAVGRPAADDDEIQLQFGF